ncbi:hypothetical protein HJC23_010366 [Cyclotella cryptica]|uniref:Phosphoglycolate phosphatase n=1 Tax=Cyclotella cryptica TaxID=29204 RepID=A0ABD3QJH5_9STRA|eukprot:CCRYP_005223-RA/>CCRYP_005223-RA protein AED:0.23 eAED:0.23 QI:220/1/1/1/0.5/0.33/3/2989/408
MRFLSRQVVLPLFLSYSVSAWSMWTGNPSPSSHPHKTRKQLFSTEQNPQESDVVLCTSADITENIRHESEQEMEKVAQYFHSKQSSIRLIKTKEELTSYMSSNNINNYLFDCDGVLYRGSDPMPDASQTMQSLLDNGKQVFFVTNNAGSSRSELKNKLEKVLSLPKGTLQEEMMIGSAFVAARYLRSLLINENKAIHKRVHVIGTAGLCQEMRNAGFDISGGPDDSPSGMSREELASYPFPEGEIDAVVIGLDNDFNYRKLCIATVLLQRNPQAVLVATNRDAFDLVGYDARHLPGNGALVSSVEVASGRTAINVGKPSPVLANWLMEEFNLNLDETMMIGDRLDTDVKFGNCSRMKCSALVLTGCTTVNEIEELMLRMEGDTNKEESREMIPTTIFPHVGYMVVNDT